MSHFPSPTFFSNAIGEEQSRIQDGFPSGSNTLHDAKKFGVHLGVRLPKVVTNSKATTQLQG